MNVQLRILGVFAHPDDELSVGGTLALYARAGAAVTLACATRGEAATIFCEDCATRETLPAVRTTEMECCCAELGVTDLRWLDWPDGGVSEVPESRALAQLVPLIRETRPHILFTHPTHGGYPHPDHIGVYERVMLALAAAADPAFMPEAGEAWITPKVYARAIPAEAFDAIPNFREYRIQLNGQALAFEIDPPEHINCIIDCADSVESRIRGWNCHRSQHNPNGTFSLLPDDLQRQIFGQEYLHLLIANLPAPLPSPHSTLEAGLPEFAHG